MQELTDIIQKIISFRNERDWEQFHNPKDLAMALNIEASELLELYLWKHADDANLDKVKEEIADVLMYAILLGEHYQLDFNKILLDKLEKNAAKYPVEKAKGNARKYNEY